MKKHGLVYRLFDAPNDTCELLRSALRMVLGVALLCVVVGAIVMMLTLLGLIAYQAPWAFVISVSGTAAFLAVIFAVMVAIEEIRDRWSEVEKISLVKTIKDKTCFKIHWTD